MFNIYFGMYFYIILYEYSIPHGNVTDFIMKRNQSCTLRVVIETTNYELKNNFSL